MTESTIKPHRAPVPSAVSFLSFSSIQFDVPGRTAPLEMRILAPAEGEMLPILLLSHGHGGSNFLSSMRGYGPLVDFYAAHGFVVIVPTHQNSKTLGLNPDGAEGALFWRSRAQDMHFIVDHLDDIEAAVPALVGRLDKASVVAVGHSMGAHTVCMLMGMRVTDPRTGQVCDLAEPRIRAGVMLSPPGNGADLASGARERFPVLAAGDFSGMAQAGLVMTGDNDFNSVFSEREDWRSDAYKLSPGPKSLVVMRNGGHMFGGISGYDAKETSDESPERVAAVQRITWSYLRTALVPNDRAWDLVAAELADTSNEIGTIEQK